MDDPVVQLEDPLFCLTGHSACEVALIGNSVVVATLVLLSLHFWTPAMFMVSCPTMLALLGSRLLPSLSPLTLMPCHFTRFFVPAFITVSLCFKCVILFLLLVLCYCAFPSRDWINQSNLICSCDHLIGRRDRTAIIDCSQLLRGRFELSRSR